MEEKDSKTMISVKHLSKKFGEVTVLKDINLDIKEKEVVVIIGPSGSGKSTILRCLNHLETPSGGEIVDRRHQTRRRCKPERHPPRSRYGLPEI